MNIFRLAGDISHLLAIIILLLKIWSSRSCAGISGKSQILFALTYTTRYLDLFTSYVSLYNSVMKLVFLVASFGTIYLMYVRFKATYDHNHDTFRLEFLVIPTLLLSLLINHDFSPLEVLWTFSIYLEAVAILPQLFMVSKTGEAESITSHYLFALGSYRGLYILNWVYRYYVEGFYDLIAIVAGVVQTILYCDFFYLYITKELFCGHKYIFNYIYLRRTESNQKLYIKKILEGRAVNVRAPDELTSYINNNRGRLSDLPSTFNSLKKNGFLHGGHQLLDSSSNDVCKVSGVGVHSFKNNLDTFALTVPNESVIGLSDDKSKCTNSEIKPLL